MAAVVRIGLGRLFRCGFSVLARGVRTGGIGEGGEGGLLGEGVMHASGICGGISFFVKILMFRAVVCICFRFCVPCEHQMKDTFRM